MPTSHDITFPKKTEFGKTLERNINTYFEKTGEKKRDHPLMFLKVTGILLFFGVSYYLLVFVANNPMKALLYSAMMVFATTAIGFNVMHDANHGALSKHKWLNRIMGFTLDILGGSSFFWRRTHNILHHTYTNIQGVDEDINFGILARMGPDQKVRSFHRFQHIYLWFVYGFMFFRWHIDYKALSQTLWPQKTSPRGWNLLMFWFGKMIFVTITFVIPMMHHAWWIVLLFYFCIIFTAGLFAAVIFSLAHSMDDAEHLLPEKESGHMPNDWPLHQIKTTVNFSPHNRFLTFYLGGLNYQVEHHLFPKICHIHYPKLAPIVQRTCEQFGIFYRVNHTLLDAIRSHFRHLKKMGQLKETST